MSKIIIGGLLLCVAIGCQQRDDMTVLPDRQGRAFVPVSAPAPARPAPAARTASAAASRSGERTVVVGPGERLYQIAEREGVDLWWLITRNDLVEAPKPGTPLVVRR